MRRVEPVFTTAPRRDKRQRHNAVKTAVALWLCLIATNAIAAATCSVSSPGLNFGPYDVFATGVTNGNATLTLTCDLNPPPGNADISYTISLSTGSSNSFVQRQMKSGGNPLGYNLYTTNLYSVVWGDGTGGATVSGTMRLTGSSANQTKTHTVFGRIPALQDAAVGSDYQDNVTVTVTY
jgi:spore coat protein U-like protein